MSDRLFLHCGLHKTATSFIQYNMGQAREVLAERGLYIPQTAAISNTPGHRNGLPGAHHNLGFEAVRQPIFRPAGGTRADLIRELQTIRGDVLVSTETLSSILRRPSDVIAWKEQAMSTGRELVVIVYLRHQASYLASRYMQMLKDFQVSERRRIPPDLVSILDMVLDLKVFPIPEHAPVGLGFSFDLSRLRDLGITCIVRNFHAIAGNPVADIMTAMGYEPLAFAQPDARVNAGDMQGTLATFLVNRLMIDDAEDTRFIGALDARLPLTNRLGTKAISDVTACFADSNDRLQRDWGIDLSIGIPKPPSPPGLSMEDVFSFEMQTMVGRLLETRFGRSMPGFFDRPAQIAARMAQIGSRPGRRARLLARTKRLYETFTARTLPSPNPAELDHWEESLSALWQASADANPGPLGKRLQR